MLVGYKNGASEQFVGDGHSTGETVVAGDVGFDVVDKYSKLSYVAKS